MTEFEVGNVKNRSGPEATSVSSCGEAHITTLKEAVAKAEALGEQHRQEAEMASKRVDHLVTELVEMSMRMAEQTAVADRVRAEFDAYRARHGGDA